MVKVLELAGSTARDNKLMGLVTIASGGVLTTIHQTLLPKKVTRKGKGEVESASQEF